MNFDIKRLQWTRMPAARRIHLSKPALHTWKSPSANGLPITGSSRTKQIDIIV